MNLKSMSAEKLINLRSQVEAALSTKIAAQRRMLESELSKLNAFNGRSARAKRAGSARGKVPPKYRNPENPTETWAGRGLTPRWLTAAIKGGKKIEDFAIGGAAKGALAKKARKKRKA